METRKYFQPIEEWGITQEDSSKRNKALTGATAKYLLWTDLRWSDANRTVGERIGMHDGRTSGT